ncbi:MAG: DUF177 domain-containing protein [Neomegalonema sp.]|nr:DUF177 domain-containing protein [Neomegalonema sp.]
MPKSTPTTPKSRKSAASGASPVSDKADIAADAQQPAPLRQLIPSARLAKLPDGLEVAVQTDETQRAAVARDLGLISLSQLSLTGKLIPWRRAGWRFEGRLQAVLEQACVVTLAPVPTSIDAPVARYWLPDSQLAQPAGSQTEIEIQFDEALGGEDIDAVGDGIDLGAVVLEALALNLDDYPRAASLGEEEFSASTGDHEPEENPFAALKALRDRLKDDEE